MHIIHIRFMNSILLNSIEFIFYIYIYIYILKCYKSIAYIQQCKTMYLYIYKLLVCRRGRGDGKSGGMCGRRKGGWEGCVDAGRGVAMPSFSLFRKMG